MRYLGNMYVLFQNDYLDACLSVDGILDLVINLRCPYNAYLMMYKFNSLVSNLMAHLMYLMYVHTCSTHKCLLTCTYLQNLVDVTGTYLTPYPSPTTAA